MRHGPVVLSRSILAIGPIVGLLLLAPIAAASVGLTPREAEPIAKRAAARSTQTAEYLRLWRATCRYVYRDGRIVETAQGTRTFSCRVVYKSGVCSGKLRVSGRSLRAYRIRVRCGDSG